MSATARAVVAAVCVLSMASTVARAQDSLRHVTPSTASWAADDLLLAEDSRDFAISPDGDRVAWVRTAMSITAGRTASSLYLSPTRGGAPMQLTTGTGTDESPRWSPDGTRIAFLSSRPGPHADSAAASTQLWLADASTGSVRIVTALERTMDDFAWKSRDTILFLAQDAPTVRERDAARRKDDSRVVDDSTTAPRSRLYSLDLKSGRIAALATKADWISRFALSPDGRRVVTVHDRSLSWGYDQRIPPVTMLTDLSTGESRQIFDGARVIPDDITWSRDGAGFYFTNDSTTSPRYRTATVGVLDYFDVASGRTHVVDHRWPRGISGNLRAIPGGVVAKLNDGVQVVLAKYVKDGARWVRRPLSGANVGHSFDFDVAPDGRALVYRYTRANVPPQLFGATLRDSTVLGDVRITDLNPSFRTKPQPTVEVVHWNGANDERVEGILTYPIGYERGRRYPLVVTIHGGPALADLDEWKQTWSYPRLLLNERGAFTLQVNYHGSSRYGLAWVESICCGKLYDLEIPDIERGIDYVIARGLVESTRIGLLGHSYGAILTAQLTTLDHRFRAASAAAGDVEWFSDWGGVKFGASYDNYYFGASPWEDPQLYVRKSPVFRLQNVRTPTIIYHGTEDQNVPPGQAWTYFRTLQQLGNAPVRLVLFPGEPHSPRRYVHQRRKIDEDLAWFDRYLFGTVDAADVASRNGAACTESPVTAICATMRP